MRASSRWGCCSPNPSSARYLPRAREDLRMSLKIAVIVGSLRRDSWTRKVAQAVIDQAPKALECNIVEIGDLEMYNEDLESNAPAAWTRFRNAVRPMSGVLFATPEYSRSIPGCLKNAIDVGPRPAGFPSHTLFPA